MKIPIFLTRLKNDKMEIVAQMADQHNHEEPHFHYSCGHIIMPEFRQNHREKLVEVTVKRRCPKCRRGKFECLYLVNATFGPKDAKCQVPGCRCTESTLRIPVDVFKEMTTKEP